MKPLFLKAFLLFSLFSMHVLHSQNLTDKDLYKLKGFNINTEKTDLNDYNVHPLNSLKSPSAFSL